MRRAGSERLVETNWYIRHCAFAPLPIVPFLNLNIAGGSASEDGEESGRMELEFDELSQRVLDPFVRAYRWATGKLGAEEEDEENEEEQQVEH